MKIVGPSYHVQSNATESRGGDPYFTHHDSFSSVWSQKFRPLCAAGIDPFEREREISI